MRYLQEQESAWKMLDFKAKQNIEDSIQQNFKILGSLIPADGLPGGDRDRVNVLNSAVESKGVILSKACEYISSMKSNYDE